MSRDDDPKSLEIYDRRIVERNIKKGLLTRKEYDKFLKALPDATDKVLPISERGLPVEDKLGDDLDEPAGPGSN